MAGFAEDYIDVAERLRIFKEKYPDGSLQPVNPERPIEVITVGERTFLAYAAAAYRTPDDARPGIGIAWEPFPGRTPYTKDSEAMNCESSAWGRAIVAALAADTKKGIASAQEVRNRQAERDGGWESEVERPPTDAQVKLFEDYAAKLGRAKNQQDINLVGELVKDSRGHHRITYVQYNELGKLAVAKAEEVREPA